ncbi:MAG: hypothetical protein HEP71_09915 [Roseivirga sp.]|nr:hypothetical protein [Roseivirga sp.]
MDTISDSFVVAKPISRFLSGLQRTMLFTVLLFFTVIVQSQEESPAFSEGSNMAYVGPVESTVGINSLNNHVNAYGSGFTAPESTTIGYVNSDIDVSNPPCDVSYTDGTSLGALDTFGQSFTATCTGKLKTLAFAGHSGNAHSLTMTVYSGEGTTTQLGQLTSQTISAGTPNATDFTRASFDFSSQGIDIVNGNQYTFIVSGGAYQQYLNNAGTYSGGRGYLTNSFNSSYDFNFKVDIGSAVNAVPTFTSLSGPVETTTEDTGVEITFAEIAAQGDEADSDGTVGAFVVQAVSTGTLTINGANFATGTNDEITAAKSAIWTPATSASGVLNAFTIKAKDNDGGESATAIQATVNVSGQAPEVSCNNTHDAGTSLFGLDSFGQSFTATCSGKLTILSTASWTSNNPTLTVTLYSGEGLSNQLAQLTNQTITNSGNSPYSKDFASTAFDFSSFNIDLVNGQQYTFLVSGSGHQQYASNSSTYAGGQGYYSGSFRDADFNFSVQVGTDNSAPSFTSAKTENFAENGTGTVYTATATDNAPVNFSLGSGNDESLFNIVGGAVTFKNTPDFESPQDGDTQNDYVVNLIAKDANGNTANQNVTITVTDVNENTAPSFTSTAVIAILDNQTYSYTPTATDADNDALTFTATTKPSWLTLRTPDNFKVSTIAGNGSRPSPPINGTGTVATFLEPEALVTDSNGNIYVADTHHQLVRKITPQGVVSTLAGQYGAGGLSGVDGTGTNATFVGLSTLTITNTDIIYVADKSIIRKVTTGGVVTTFAGNNDAGNTATDFPTDGTGTAANFHEIDAMVVDANGNLFVGDKNNINTSGIIRKVTPAGVVTTLAGGQTGGTTGGTGTAAQFTMPRGMDFDSQGVLHFADASIIYKMDGNNVVTPIAGSTGGAQDIDGTGTSARFNFIRGIALDSKDDIYVVAGPSQRVRKVTQQGVVTTPIGLVLGFLDGYDNDAKFNQPFGIHIDDNDVFYISDRENGAIRKIEKSAVLLTGDPASQIGNHNVTLKVDDGNGGTAEQTFVVAVTAPLAVSISAQSDISCNGGSDGSATAAGAGGTSPYTYSWNDGSTTATVNTFSAGTYTVTVTDNAAATTTTTVTLTEPVALGASATVDSNVSCNRGSDGSATAVGSGGTAPYTYFWNNGATTASITGQTAGTYTVSITDANGCNPAVDQITITEPAVLDVSVTGQTNVSAFGGADGSATAQASGGTAPYTYSWNNGQVGATANGLFASTYTVSVTDANGCNPAITSVTITQPANSLPVFTSTPVTSILDNQIYNYPLTASDANDEFFTFTLTSPTAPSWLSIVTEYEGEVTTFAGSGFGSQQDGTGTSATFASPKSVATDATGNIYIAESGIGGTPLIRKVSPDGVVTTIAGGASGYVDGTGTNAGFIRPFGIAVDVSGNIFVSDLGSTNANTIRKITPEGVVTTFAGSAGFSGNTDSHGTSASFTSPKGLAFDSSGNLFVADGFNVRKITPDRFVTTFAGTGSAGSAEGTGTSASFNEPIDIAIDGSDNLYVSDYLNNKIRKITPTGIVGTFVGTGSQGSADGPGTSATFYFPFGLTFDNSGNLYVADWANEKIRKVTPGRVVSTFAGSGTTGSQDGIGTSASFNYPDGIAFNIDNAIYVGDDANHLLRRVSLGSVKLTGTPTSMLVGDHNVTLKVADGNSGTAEQSFILTVVKSNTAPVVDLNGATAGLTTAHNYNENSEIKFATAGTVSDSDNDNITSMTVTITNSTQSNDDHYVAMDFQATAEKTAATNAGVTIGFMSNGVMNITGGASAQIYQDILQNLIYGNSSDVPPSETFNIEVVVNDGTVNSATASSAITIIPLNDGSSAFGTGNDPTFTEGGNAVTLFSNMTGHTQEANETITGFKFTVTNVTSNSGADEKLTVDGTAIALNNGNSGTTSGNNLSYSVSISGSTATVSLSGGTFTASAFATLLEGVKYENINQNPSNASREVTLSEVTDSGAQGAGHDNPWATNHAVSTVSVSPVNDPSVFTSATTANFAENGTGTAYTITATDVESSNFTYALGTGNDEDKFNINGNLVTFKTAPDFENPTDGGTNNTYVIEVKVTENSLTVNQNVTITVTDVVEDVTSPVLSTPTVSNLQDLYFTLNLDLDESGTAYYVVVADGANAPTSAEVKAGTASGGGSAIISGNKAFNESPEFSGIAQIAVLTPVTSYDVYVVAEDVNANLQAIPTKVDVTTAVLSPNFRWTTATRPSNGTVAETVNGVTATVTTSGTDADFADASNGLGTIFNLVGATGVNASMTVTFDSPVNLTSIQLLYLAPSANWLLTPAGGSNAVVNSGELSPGGNVVNVNWIGVTSFTLTLEGGGTTNFGMDEIVVNPNSAPVVDLDGATSGFINENGSIGIADYATVTDADNDNIVSMTISVTGYTGTNADQYLGINGAINTIATNAGVTVGAYDTNTGIMAITGSATAATYQSILQGIVYGNNSDTPPAGDVVIHIEVNDGTVKSSDVTNTITITPVNDEPVFTSQVVTSVNEGEPYTYNFAATDVDGDALSFTTPTTPSWLSLVNAPGGIGSAVSTFAGNGTAGNQNGTGTNAILDTPVSFTIDANGNLYALTKSGEIKKITAQGVVSTYLSQVISGITDASSSQMDIDSNGNIYYTVGDATVMKVTPQGVSSTFIADPRSGKNPELAIISGGNYFVIDNNDVMYFRSFSGFLKIDLNTNQVTEVFANGPSMPERVGEDNQGNIILTVVDLAGVANTTIQKLNGDNSLTLLLDLGAPTIIDDLVFDASGNMIFVDKAAHLVKTYNATDGIVTLAGGAGQSLIDGTGTSAGFNKPISIEIDNSQNLYVLDVLNHAIRKIEANAGQQSLSGTAPSTAGTHNVVLKADDNNGGTAEQSFTITVNDVTDPVFTSATAVNFAENGTGTAYTVVATDANQVTYSLGTGNDEGLFNINGGIVTFKNAPDFEAPADGDTNNTYVINVIASDGTHSVNQDVTITVTDVNENVAPVFTSQPVTSLEFGETYNYEFAATDGNGDALTFTAPTLPTALSLTSSAGNVVSTVAGASTGGSTDGTASSATFNEPQDVAIDSQGNLYVSDLENYRIRKITPAGVVTTLAGGGKGQSDGTGTAAAFRAVKGIVVDSNDNIFVADTDSHTIRKVTQAGVVTSFAGTIGSGGTTDGTGTNARFNIPYGLTIDSNDNLYVTDAQNSGIVRKITPAGVVTTLPSIGFNQGIGIIGIAADVAGDVYLSNHISQKIVKLDVSAGTTSDFVSLGFNPYDLAFDKDGNLFISDATNAIYVRNSSGTVSLLAGGTTGSTDGAGAAAAFNAPLGLTTDATGSLFIAERDAHNIRMIAAGGQRISGTVNSLGDFNVVLRADDSNGGVTEQAFTITVSDNTDPSFTSVTTASFAENGTGTAYTIAATDASALTYSLGTGNDEGLFNIANGLVTFKAAPDFENPTDGNTDNDYVINVIATDAVNNSSNQNVTITVTDVQENVAPVFTSQPVTSLEFGETYNYEFTASDANGDALTFTAPTLPSALSITSSVGNVVSTVAGASTGGSTDGTASSATFNKPQDVAIDSQGNLYVSDLENYRIRKITPAGVVTTLAGGGKGQSDGTGTAAAFRAVKGIVVDSNDNIFVADTDSHTIRKVTQAGVVTSFAGTIGLGGTTDGTGTNARFNIPYGLTIDSNDNLYVTDAQNSGIVRKITPAGVVTTLPSIGFDQGNGIIGIAVDAAGDLYLSNHISQKMVNLEALLQTLHRLALILMTWPSIKTVTCLFLTQQMLFMSGIHQAQYLF